MLYERHLINKVPSRQHCGIVDGIASKDAVLRSLRERTGLVLGLVDDECPRRLSRRRLKTNNRRNREDWKTLLV
jgi:hypothetical protein